MIENILEEKILNFTSAIKKTLNDKNWYAALTLSLTLPDICGSLEFPEKSSSKRFIDWFNVYLLDKYSLSNTLGTYVFLNGEDAYALRCAYLHQGEANIENQWIRKALSEFLFVEPLESGSIHCNQVDNILQLQVDIFCEEICIAVEKWIETVSSDQEIQERAKKLLTIHKVGP